MDCLWQCLRGRDDTGRVQNQPLPTVNQPEISMHERIVLESLRKYARGPVQELYREYNTILSTYIKTAHDYPNNRRVKRAVPTYIEVLKDDIELVRDFIMGARPYKQKDVIRLKTRVDAFKRAHEYLMKKVEEIEDNPDETIDEPETTASPVTTSPAAATVPGSVSVGAAVAAAAAATEYRTAVTQNPAQRYVVQYVPAVPAVVAPVPTVRTPTQPAVSHSVSQVTAITANTTRAPSHHNSQTSAAQVSGSRSSQSSPQSNEAEVVRGPSEDRPPSPDFFFPCPPPYREIDPEAPPMYAVHDGRMQSYRFLRSTSSNNDPRLSGNYPPRSNPHRTSRTPSYTHPTSIPPPSLLPPPDHGDAPPSYEEAASTAV